MQIPANKLAEFITAKTPERRERIVRQVKSGGSGHPNYYQCFQKPAKEFLIAGANDATGLLRVIEHLKTRTETPWKATDSRITTEAVKALINLGPQLYGLRVEFVPPGSRKTLLHFPEADISVPPNLLIHGTRNGKPLLGALRFYLAKESLYHLGIRGAEMVAVMQYQLLTQIASGERAPDTELCIIVECLQRRMTSAPSDPTLHIAAIERGVREFARLWHQMDDKEAA